MKDQPKMRRGFAAMNAEQRREISRKGGASVAPHNRAFSKDRELAAMAGTRGGVASGKVRGKGKRAPLTPSP